METPSSISAQRTVPGAPPSTDKLAAKKKRKHKSSVQAVHTDADPSSDPSLLGTGPDLLKPQTQTTQNIASISDDKAAKTVSPIQEVLHRRTRNLTKKIQRIKEYLSKPPDSLNDDQKKAIASLPHLEFAVQEFDDLRKALEPVEAQSTQLHLQELQKVTNEVETSIQDALQKQQRYIISKLPLIVTLSHWNTAASSLTATELHAMQYIGALLLDKEQSPEKSEALEGLLTGDGSWNGVEYARLLEIVGTESKPLQEEQLEAETPHSEEDGELSTATGINGDQQDTDEPAEAVIAPSVSQESGLGGSFHFMQASELDEASAASHLQEGLNAELSEPLALNDTELEAPSHVIHNSSEPLPPPPKFDTLDWAADDANELESITSLHEKFGTSPAGSGGVTPMKREVTPKLPEVTLAPQRDDGFTAVARRGTGPQPNAGGDRGSYRGERDRGRGRVNRGGRGGWRGESHGEPRGGDGRGRGRGSRGGERGGFRGGGAPRGVS